MAIGLENGEILIYANSSASVSTWDKELSIDSRYVEDYLTLLSR